MIKLPLMFSTHMMLQAGKPVRVFGAADAGKTITACVTGPDGAIAAKGSAAADADGKFEIILPELMAGLDRKLVITDGAETIEIEDVAVGELWLAGGQSNMEYLMHTDAERDAEISKLASMPAEERRMIRFFGFPEIAFEGMEEHADFSSFGKWRCLTEEDLPYFCAVGYYFQRKLHEKIDGPVGVLACNWGGTKACCWVPEETIRDCGAGAWLDEYEAGLQAVPELDKLLESYRNNPMNVQGDPAKPSPMDGILFPGFSRQTQEQAMSMFNQPGAEVMMMIHPLHPWRPAGLYYTMLKKIIPYTFRGVIWYQGCSDESHPELYAQLMEALIAKWREDFKDPDLPFYQVQLAPFGWWLGNEGNNYPAVREAQQIVADETPETYLASIGDAGMQFDIHPKHKRKPGERLGLLALCHTYGLPVAAEAPRAEKMDYDGDTAVIHFVNAEGLTLTAPENGGLTKEEAERVGFTDPDVPEPLDSADNLNALIHTIPEGTVSAAIEGDTLRVALKEDGRSVKPEHVDFAWTGYYEVNVKNAAGLPVFPFRF